MSFPELKIRATFSTLPTEIRLEIYRFSLRLPKDVHIEVAPTRAFPEWSPRDHYMMRKTWKQKFGRFVTRYPQNVQEWTFIPHGALLRDFLSLALLDRRTYDEITDLLYSSAHFHVWIGRAWESRFNKTLPSDRTTKGVFSFDAFNAETVSRIMSLGVTVQENLRSRKRRAAVDAIARVVDLLTIAPNRLRYLFVHFNALKLERRRWVVEQKPKEQQKYQYLLEPLVQLAPLPRALVIGSVRPEFARKLASALKGTQKGALTKIDYPTRQLMVGGYYGGRRTRLTEKRLIRRSTKCYSDPAYDWDTIEAPTEMEE